MLNVDTQWHGKWNRIHLDFAQIDHAVEFCKVSTTTPWRVLDGKRVVAEGHAKRVYKQVSG